MAVIAISKPQEDFIVQINGDYNLPFSEETAVAAVASGEVIVWKDGHAIAAKAAEAGERVRLMVRGNPTTVNALALSGVALSEAVLTSLEDKGIIVVNL